MLGATRGGPALVLAALLGLSACATPRSPPVSERPVETPPPARPAPQSVALTDLPGWGEENHLAALSAFADGCQASRDPAARPLCDTARAMMFAAARLPTPSEARAFLEAAFVAVEARTADGRPGLLTSYFAPEYEARRTPDAVFDTPVLGVPSDWVRQGGVAATRSPDGAVTPGYADRAAIEAGVLGDRAPILAWMKAEDLFFMQIQGSGYLTFEDGGQARAAYAADNGRPFTGIARPMADQGLLPRNGTSGEAISDWLAAHRGPEADAVMALNPRYIFFQVQPDDGGHPAGAAGIPLPERRAIAVDPAAWRYGDVVWIEADAGNLIGARAGYRGLVMALDTGSAIRGPVRADLYMGRGPAAGDEAGSVRHPLRMWRLVPR